MLKKFFLNVLSSFMGAWLAIVVSGLCLFLVVLGVIGVMASRNVSIDKDSVLKIDLSGELIERADPSQIDFVTLLSEGSLDFQTVETLVNAIKEAKTNKNIKAIYLDCGSLSAAPASINAVREALLDFKKSKKPVYAYADQYSQSAYFIATTADRIVVNPEGSVDLHGLGGQHLFYKDLFDKIGLEFQVVRVGEGKSAVEPYTQNQMSEYARNQSMQLIDTIWYGIRGTIAKSRSLNPTQIDTLINRDIPSIQNGTFALNHKLVDATMYRHEFIDFFSEQLGGIEIDENFVSPSALFDYYQITSVSTSDNQIAVLYACGGIDTEMNGGGINSQKIVDEIIALGKDDDVKGLVLRVNSPGGSAYGSEQIWEAIEWFKKQKKPVVVSMGDYAASGGYYISCNADYIFADPYTITGSIGIFGLIPNVSGLMEKIGVHSEMVATNPQAQLFTLFTPLDGYQLASMQKMVERGYELFVKRCADGRGLPVDSIKSIADGRPLAAPVALQLKLVDKLGGLQQAVEMAAQKAGLKDDYNVGVYPVLESNLFLNLFTSAEMTLPASVQNLLIEQNWDKEMMRRLGNVLSNDKIRAEYNLLKVRM